jgi:hypothetical protein
VKVTALCRPESTIRSVKRKTITDQGIEKDTERGGRVRNLRYLPDISLEGLKKTTKTLNRDGRCSE